MYNNIYTMIAVIYNRVALNITTILIEVVYYFYYMVYYDMNSI